MLILWKKTISPRTQYGKYKQINTFLKLLAKKSKTIMKNLFEKKNYVSVLRLIFRKIMRVKWVSDLNLKKKLKILIKINDG